MPRVVLHQPQIPPNTGNVARTCAATCSELHLIHPLGFSLENRYLRRAGLDYWPLVRLKEHPSWETFRVHRRQHPGRLLAFSRHSEQPYHHFAFGHHDWLLFGCETTGLPAELLAAADACLTIPMPGALLADGGVRSLNLSVAVGVVLFEALRQLGTGRQNDLDQAGGS